jgi:uncharacterized membrane protein (UPF0127 family)
MLSEAMKNLLKTLLILCAACFVVPTISLAQSVAISGPQAGLRVERLSIETPKGVRSFKVEIADTPKLREIGMMWRMQVPRGTGMLFDFKVAKPATFWMENTLVSLDLIFIRENGTIANIAANAAPLSRALIPSDGPILAVLEIGAGEAMRLGIKPGQKVSHRIFAR